VERRQERQEERSFNPGICGDAKSSHFLPQQPFNISGFLYSKAHTKLGFLHAEPPPPAEIQTVLLRCDALQAL
jgi:hypothetical protein